VVRAAVRFGETAAEVLKLAAEEDAHLIVVGAHSRLPAVAAMVGSCADRIVRESPCPVLAVPSPAPALTAPVLHPIYA
jgi:nucleotide-binding universal stress UspA family protein